MAMVIFYEKPGCANNTRQKQLLVNAGHQVIAKNLLKNNFKAKTLRAFLANKTIPEWFNRAAPAIKSGQIVPEELDEMTALALLLTYPLLIRRPLIQVGDICEAGFDQARINEWIGLTPEQVSALAQQNLEQCRHKTAAGLQPAL